MFLTPNIHKVKNHQRVDVLSKMHVKQTMVYNFMAVQMAISNFQNFYCEISIWKNTIFLSTAYLFWKFSENQKSSKPPRAIK